MSDRFIFANLAVVELSAWLIILALGWGGHPVLLIPWLAFGLYVGGLTYNAWRGL